MKRIIKRRWDPVNGCVHARLYKVWTGEDGKPISCAVYGFQSPIRLPDMKAARHRMQRTSLPQWFGRDAVRELARVMRVR